MNYKLYAFINFLFYDDDIRFYLKDACDYISRKLFKYFKIKEQTIQANPTNRDTLLTNSIITTFEKNLSKLNITFVTQTSKTITELINTKPNNKLQLERGILLYYW